MEKRYQCLNSRDTFCHMCGEQAYMYIIKPHAETRHDGLVKKVYELYHFVCKIGDQDKKWAPDFCCGRCAVDPRAQFRRQCRLLSPEVSREQKDHITDLTEYTNLPSVMRLVPHALQIWRLRLHDKSLSIPKLYTWTTAVTSVNGIAAIEDYIILKRTGHSVRIVKGGIRAWSTPQRYSCLFYT